MPNPMPRFPTVNDAMAHARRQAHISGRRYRVWFDPTQRQWRITPTRTRIRNGHG